MIDLEDVDGIAVVRLAHGKVNALDLELLASITETFTALDSSAHRGIVLTGNGRAFSAGVDLWRIIEGGAEYIGAFMPALTEAFLAVFSIGKPVVAAINGHAIAGGAVFACACDHRVMAHPGGRIGVTELHVGVPFPLSALEILSFAMGERAARAAVLSADTYEPHIAHNQGFVDDVVGPDELLDTCLAAAERLAAQIPADTYRLTKAGLRLAVHERLARRATAYDPLVAELWIKRVEDGWLRRYMDQVTARR